MIRLLLTFLVFTLFPPFINAQAGEDIEDLLVKRLSLMKSVAAYKWKNSLPVEDGNREENVLAASVQAGLNYGLTKQSSLDFFQAQIEAAKEIQAYWIQMWEEGNLPPDNTPDLATEIRPELLKLGNRIVAAAGNTDVNWEQFSRQVAVDGLSMAAKRRIFDALASLATYPDRLTQILDSGILRIGTTGDYEPFSLKNDGEGEFRGIDIDLGRDLAVALGVTPVFVQTSWPTLMADLRAGNFDIAMSGVSRTLERQRQGYFSQPYHVGGKTAISRCEDAERFDSLGNIDQPGVRVIVNPGGTNERFVESRIRSAKKILHQDNRTIFSQIATGEADVMITDRIEADWHSSQNPGLCTPVDKNFTYHEKAYLMPRDIALKEFVDTWLSLRKAEGKISKMLSQN